MSNFNEQYKAYNDVKVTLKLHKNRNIIEEYVISNINKAGNPSSNCECHLESINIDPPAVGQDNPNGCGTTGDITVIDYKNAVFNRLSNHLTSFLEFSNDNKVSAVTANVSSNELCPLVHIEINCYTKNYSVYGYIQSWSFVFSGSTPSISMKWTTICPPCGTLAKPRVNSNAQEDYEGKNQIDTSKSKENKENASVEPSETKSVNACVMPTYTIVMNPTEFIDIAKQTCANEAVEIIFLNDDGTPHKKGDVYTVPDGVKFVQTSGIPYVQNSPNASPSPIVNQYYYMVSQLAPASDGSTWTAESEVNSEGKQIMYVRKTKCYTPAPSTSSATNTTTSSAEACADLIFVQNGKYPAYLPLKMDDGSTRIVIPMTSFNFETDFAKLTLQTSIRQAAGGGTVITNPDGTVQASNGTAEAAANAANALSASTNNDPITITFDCYNVMSFDRNNLNAPIALLIFDEFGNLHPLSKDIHNNKNYKSAMVRSCKYSLSGAVIKATIECTTVFNSILGTKENQIGKTNEITATDDTVQDNASTETDTSGVSSGAQ